MPDNLTPNSDAALQSLLDRYKATNDPTEMEELSRQIERNIFHKQYENVESPHAD